ncbi:hypothetical protein SNE40_016813 [Patella caerulea]|uniref:Glycosyltransferase n=1 Tax=Patella caerulea TaxID=87958 RepID=A0AAN8JFG5_PATCE
MPEESFTSDAMMVWNSVKRSCLGTIKVLVILTGGCFLLLLKSTIEEPDHVNRIIGTISVFRRITHSITGYKSNERKIRCPGCEPPYLATSINPCENITLTASTLSRKRLEIHCDEKYTWTEHSIVRSNANPFTVNSDDQCLERFIQENCYDNKIVPNVIHYVWFNKHVMDVYSFLSVISTYKRIKPCLIIIHADVMPYGPYWVYLLTLVPNLIHIYKPAPISIFGKRLGYVQHKADIARLEILKAHGGIYFDFDQIALKNFDQFRHYDFVMAHENIHNLGNAVIVSKKNAPFIDLWYNNYDTYNPTEWGIHSTFVPFRIAQKHKDLIHIEKEAFFKPDLAAIEKLYTGKIDLSKNHAIHLYVRSIKKYYTLDQFRKMNTTLGELARSVLYDSKNLCL